MPKGTPDEESLEEDSRKEDQKVSREKEKEKTRFSFQVKRQRLCALYDEYQQQQTDPVFYGKFGKSKGKKGKFKGKKGFGGKDKGKDGKDSFKAKGKGQPSQANVASNQRQSAQEEPNTAQQPSYQEEGWGYQSEWTDWSAADSWYDESYYGHYDDSYDWQGSWSYFVESVEDGRPDHRTTNEKKSYCSLVSTKDQFRVFGQHCINAFVAIFVCIVFAARILNSVMFPEDHDDCPASVGLNNSEPSDHAYPNFHHDIKLTLLTEYIDLKTHPTYVILDSGCTKAMGSRYAVDRLVHACKQHKDSHNIWFSTESCFSRFAFANGEQPTVRERLIIHLRNRTSTTGWITTSVDILDKGRVPILFSAEQMRNLRMNIEHTPVGEFLICPMFGMKKTPLAVTPHIGITVISQVKEPMLSFLPKIARFRRADNQDNQKHKTTTRGSIVDYESHKITTTTQSTTVAELGALMMCFGTCLFVRALWADVSGEILPIHIRTDANNLVTTAQTTHLPEQKETHHLIQMLRHESNTGHLDDLSHIASEYCLADPLTKHSAKRRSTYSVDWDRSAWAGWCTSAIPISAQT